MENQAATLIEQQAKRIHELELENRGAQLSAGMSRLMFANMQEQEKRIAELQASIAAPAAVIGKFLDDCEARERDLLRSEPNERGLQLSVSRTLCVIHDMRRDLEKAQMTFGRA